VLIYEFLPVDADLQVRLQTTATVSLNLATRDARKQPVVNV